MFVKFVNTDNVMFLFAIWGEDSYCHFRLTEIEATDWSAVVVVK
jgi:hypothetical protein